jgi:hypothetical protein
MTEAPKNDLVTMKLGPQPAVNSLTISGLSDDQFERLAKGVKDAVKPDPTSKFVQAVARLVGTTFLMIPAAGSVWIVAYILTNLPGR